MKNTLLLVCSLFLLFGCSKRDDNSISLPDSYSNQQLGASAHDMLSAEKFTTVLIEVQYMRGYRLEDAALAELTNFLNSLCNKPGGVIINQSEIANNGDTLTVDEVAAIEKANRTRYNSDKFLAVYILVTDGYNNVSGTLGFAYRNTSLCLLGKNIFDHSGGVGQVSRKTLEALVLEHELGHILGLVNIGSSMQAPHEDLVNTKHCNNEHCLMYYEIETNSSLASLLGGNVPVLDDNCRNDLRANGGK